MKISNKDKILYICQNAIGDIIATLPSIHFLRKHYPSCQLDILINKKFKNLFIADPNVDNVIGIDNKCYGVDTSSRCPIPINKLSNFYNVIIDSYCSKNTVSLLKKVKHSYSVGIDFNKNVKLFGLSIRKKKWMKWGQGNRDTVDCFGDLVRLFNKSYKATYPVLYIDKKSIKNIDKWMVKKNLLEKRIIAINPGSGNYLKRWDINNFIRLAQFLQKDSYEIAFIFGPKENKLFKEAEATLRENKFNSIKNFSLQNLGAFLKKCKMLITNDCAVMHVGASVGCKTTAIFGPSNSKIWFPYDRKIHKVIELDMNCRKQCKYGCKKINCMKGITPEMVYSMTKN